MRLLTVWISVLLVNMSIIRSDPSIDITNIKKHHSHQEGIKKHPAKQLDADAIKGIKKHPAKQLDAGTMDHHAFKHKKQFRRNSNISESREKNDTEVTQTKSTTGQVSKAMAETGKMYYVTEIPVTITAPSSSKHQSNLPKAEKLKEQKSNDQSEGTENSVLLESGENNNPGAEKVSAQGKEENLKEIQNSKLLQPEENNDRESNQSNTTSNHVSEDAAATRNKIDVNEATTVSLKTSNRENKDAIPKAERVKQGAIVDKHRKKVRFNNPVYIECLTLIK